LTAYHLFELRVRWNLEIEERGTLWVWFVLGLLTDAGFTAWAIYRLGADFRTRAADRFRAGKRRLWQAVLGLR
jgi:hypothetical protein